MNVHIKECWLKAARADSDPNNWDSQEQFIERFARIIIDECVRIVQNKSTDIFKMSKKEGDIFEYYSHGAEDAAYAIQEHFGVEE